MSGEHSIKQLCGTLGVSRSGYYQWRSGRAARARRSEEITRKIKAVHAESRCTYGSPRVSAALRAQGERVGRNRVARLMKEAGIEGRQRRRHRVRTTDSRHDEPIALNRLADASPPARPDEVWVADITYVETAEGWLYLVGVLHHSDRGCQYASASYRRALAEHGFIASMSRRANCYDNAAMEAFWSTLKQELVYRRRFLTRGQATTAIFDYIEGFYNRSRLHSALGFTSPLDHESNLN